MFENSYTGDNSYNVSTYFFPANTDNSVTDKQMHNYKKVFISAFYYERVCANNTGIFIYRKM